MSLATALLIAMQKDCAHCGNAFVSSPSRMGRPRIYCSERCGQAALRKRKRELLPDDVASRAQQARFASHAILAERHAAEFAEIYVEQRRIRGIC